MTVKDPDMAMLVPGLRHNGLKAYDEPRERYWVPAMGNVDFDWDNVWPYNFCIGEVQCALGTALLKRVDLLGEKRRRRAKKFIDAVKDYPELVFRLYPVIIQQQDICFLQSMTAMNWEKQIMILLRECTKNIMLRWLYNIIHCTDIPCS